SLVIFSVRHTHGKWVPDWVPPLVLKAD
ncbi:MAG: hypothetical protein H6Q51_2580, partial [Deltaproteobacteria bacterium]|nr:hypothetical protein [Deltaproteobacteria bacterium]